MAPRAQMLRHTAVRKCSSLTPDLVGLNCWRGQIRALEGLLLTPQCKSEPQIERRKHKDDADICYQPLPEPVPEEQDIHAHDNGYQSKHVKRDGGVSSHRFHPTFWRFSRLGSDHCAGEGERMCAARVSVEASVGSSAGRGISPGEGFGVADR